MNDVGPTRQDPAATRKSQHVLLVTRNFPPLWGGMELLNLHLARELARRCRVTAVAPVGAAAFATDNVHIVEVPLQPLWRFFTGALWHAWRKARQQRPTFVLAGSGLTAPVAWLAARLSGARAAVYLHGLDIAYSSPLYNLLWLPAIRRADVIIANSNATANEAVARGVPQPVITVIHPGVELGDGGADSGAGDEFRRAHGLVEQKILLSVGRLTERKGLRQFVADVLPIIIRKCPQALLLVVGDAPTQALHATSQSVQSIQQTADELGIGAHLKFLGVITDRKALAAIYQAADVHVFPVRELRDDPEGFGMVAAEAASWGLATAAYATGGVIDALCDGKSGYLAPPGDTDALASNVLKLLDAPLPADGIREHAAQFAWPNFGSKLRKVLDLQ